MEELELHFTLSAAGVVNQTLRLQFFFFPAKISFTFLMLPFLMT